MLSYTFQHLIGFGEKKERDLWKKGITSWKALEAIENRQLSLFEGNPDEPKSSIFQLSQKALIEEDSEFFAKNLPRREYYRIALSYPSKTLFLDIETTGLSRFYDTITLTGWSLGQEYNILIKGDDDKAFRRAISESKVIITFNGSLFDLPFIREEFGNLAIPLCHIDLRFLARRIGLSGGQKVIEDIIGLKRPKYLSNLRGVDAPVLWHMYTWGKTSALKKLIAYNHADIEGMKVIFDYIVKHILQESPIPLNKNSFHKFSKNKSKIKWSREKTNPDEGINIHPYEGKPGPIISFKDLHLPSYENNFRIVGIDLTGSKSRASGWCLLENDYAITKLLGSNEEIINETIKSYPDLISIDSPLSLPKGRISATDEDPGRKTYGIMRHCERILKKRGINVYPSLINSMQKLTLRGIQLANHFRSLGIPVIESYPGAAQDIMGIPRKRVSLKFLAKGIERFGIKGDFVSNPVTHDELDAITSAIVGLFFWGGKFEALGNEDEDYLIIPCIDKGPTIWKKRRVIGFSGPIAAGKTTAASFLKPEGFHYGRFSLVLETLLHDSGQIPSREKLQRIGEDVNKNKGQRWLCKKLTQIFSEQGDIVIDGLRFPEDHAFFIEKYGPSFLHIHIDAPKSARLNRYISMGLKENEFMEAISHPVESNVNKLSKLAHIILPNTETIESFKTNTIQTINHRCKSGES